MNILKIRYSYDAYRNAVEKWFKKIGVNEDDYSTHSLRRGGAYNYAKKGVSAGSIKMVGGCRSSCFLTYLQTNEADVAKEIRSKL